MLLIGKDLVIFTNSVDFQNYLKKQDYDQYSLPVNEQWKLWRNGF